MENKIRIVYVVTVVEYTDGNECEPTNFIFDNQDAANECFRFFSRRSDIKLFMEQDEVFGRFPSFLEKVFYDQ